MSTREADTKVRRACLLPCAALIALLLAGCGGGHATAPTPTATEEPSPTPEPAPYGPVSVITSIQAQCLFTDAGADLVATIEVRVSGTTMRRFRLLDNDKVVEDSGVISTDQFRQEYTIKVDAGSEHRLSIQIDAPGANANGPTTITRCGSAPSGPRA